MKSKIKSLAIVCAEGTKIYSVSSTYNKLLLDKIEDKTIEYPDSTTVIYMGSTKEGAIVFEVINAPIVVEYTLEVEDD